MSRGEGRAKKNDIKGKKYNDSFIPKKIFMLNWTLIKWIKLIAIPLIQG